jgi:1,4-dihydroxy-2-naphthoyl-CoA hydrolase
MDVKQGQRAFTVRRRVAFGDTDVAGSVFFSNVTRYCMEAIEEWFIDRLGTDWYRLTMDQDLGTPFVRAELEFSRAATPRDSLELEIRATALGRSSSEFTVCARAVPSQERCWIGRFKCVFVGTAAQKSLPIPDEFRPVFECDAAIAQ